MVQNLVQLSLVFSELLKKDAEYVLWHYQHFVCTFQSDPGMACSKPNILYLVAGFH